MNKSVLKICQDVAHKVGVKPPTALIGSTNPNSIRFITLLEDECRFLRNQRVFPQQKKLHTITAQTGIAFYPMPFDFYSIVRGTVYDRQLSRRMVGPLGDPAFNERLYGAGSSNNVAWRIYGPDFIGGTSEGRININPVPSNNTDEYSFDYITKYMFFDVAWSLGSETPLSDSYMALFDDDIVLKGVEWRYRESKGQQYSDQKAEHDALVGSAVARWAPIYRGTMGGPISGPHMTIKDGDGSWEI